MKRALIVVFFCLTIPIFSYSYSEEYKIAAEIDSFRWEIVEFSSESRDSSTEYLSGKTKVFITRSVHIKRRTPLDTVFLSEKVRNDGIYTYYVLDIWEHREDPSYSLEYKDFEYRRYLAGYAWLRFENFFETNKEYFWDPDIHGIDSRMLESSVLVWDWRMVEIAFFFVFVGFFSLYLGRFWGDIKDGEWKKMGIWIAGMLVMGAVHAVGAYDLLGIDAYVSNSLGGCLIFFAGIAPIFGGYALFHEKKKNRDRDPGQARKIAFPLYLLIIGGYFLAFAITSESILTVPVFAVLYLVAGIVAYRLPIPKFMIEK